MYLINIFCKTYTGDDIKEAVINNPEGSCLPEEPCLNWVLKDSKGPSTTRGEEHFPKRLEHAKRCGEQDIFGEPLYKVKFRKYFWL